MKSKKKGVTTLDIVLQADNSFAPSTPIVCSSCKVGHLLWDPFHGVLHCRMCFRHFHYNGGVLQPTCESPCIHCLREASYHG